VTASLG